MKNTNILVIGKGKLAQSIIDNLKSYDKDLKILGTVDSYTSSLLEKAPLHLDERTVFVHVGSGRQYSETLQLAQRIGGIYIQAATVKDHPMPPPEKDSCVYMNAPNLSLDIIRFFFMVKRMAPLFSDHRKTIMESHQSSKESAPGTALKICELLGIPEENLKSIRQREIQRDLGIENLNLHAFHRIILTKGDSEIKLETRIEGHEPYVAGLYEILRVIDRLGRGSHDVEDLVEKGII